MSERDGSPGRQWALPVVAVLLIVLPATGGALVYSTFVLSIGETPDLNVQAGATVAGNATAGTVTVTFTSNQNADHLLARFAENGTAFRRANASAGANATDEGVRLAAVGEQVTFVQRQPSENTTAEVVVVAVEGDRRDVIVVKDVAV